MVATEVSVTPDTAWRQLYLTYSMVFKAIERSIAATGVTLPQALALDTILTSPEPMTPSRLAHQLTQETQSVTGLIDRMEKQEWVRRVRDLPDRRAIRVELTECGQSKLAETITPNRQATDRLFAPLSSAELTHLVSLLERVYYAAQPAGGQESI